MGCAECSRIAKLFSNAINNQAELRAKGIAALQGGDKIATQALEGALELSTADIHALRTQLLRHEASHVT